MWWWMLTVACAADPPAFSVGASGFASVVNTPANDAALEDYGFAPVRSVFLPWWGVRGRVRFDNDLVVGMAMRSSFARSDVASTPVPTTTTWTVMGPTVAWAAQSWLEVGGDLGFASLTHTVGSDRQGGALVYLGPYVEPRVSFVLLEAPQFIGLSLSYLTHLPVGPAHRQALWEEPFRRPVAHGLMIGLTTGVGVRP